MCARGARARAQRAQQHHVPVGHPILTSRSSESAQRAACQNEDLHALASKSFYQSELRYKFKFSFYLIL